jgi:hypothetical protein
MDEWLGPNSVEDGTIINDTKNKRKEAVKTAFDGIETAMNLPAGSTPIPKGLAKSVKKNTELAVQGAKEVLADPEESFEDKEFIRTTIKTLIIKMQGTIEIMEGSIMVGAEPRMFEVYSDLNKSVLDACAKLMQLQKQSDTAKMMKGGPAEDVVEVTQTKTIKAKGSDMASFMEQLRGNPVS